ncbi:MAG: carbohydrate-binding family 9-like protein, partial [Calditrichia bacterium]
MKYILLRCGFLGIFLISIFMITAVKGGENMSSEVMVKKCKNFKITGNGSSAEWDKTDWIDILPIKNNTRNLATQAKVLYSDSGLYFLYRCADEKLTATMNADFMDLWNEDVVEVFLWPDEQFPIYFEYEISPLNHELPILVPNLNGKLLGWRPWHYEGDRRTQHETGIQGGEKKSGADISGWTAEFFIPYKLLEPLGNMPPKSGTRWRANMYRCDYDTGE